MVEEANRSNWTEWERAWAEEHINTTDFLQKMSEEDCNEWLTARRKRAAKEKQPKEEMTLVQYMYEVAGTLD